MFLDTNGAKLFVTRSGSMQGTTILAIGGWIGSSELWQEPLAMLSDSFTTVSYDHRGSGLTIADTATITFDNLINDAVAVLDANNIRQCVLVAAICRCTDCPCSSCATCGQGVAFGDCRWHV